MEEAHLLVDGQRCSASLFDFGLFFYTNAKQVRLTGPPACAAGVPCRALPCPACPAAQHRVLHAQAPLAPCLQTLAIGAGPYFYLPKMESHLEAR